MVYLNVLAQYTVQRTRLDSDMKSGDIVRKCKLFR
jgi:hypothetical protein